MPRLRLTLLAQNGCGARCGVSGIEVDKSAGAIPMMKTCCLTAGIDPVVAADAPMLTADKFKDVRMSLQALF